MLCLEGKCRAEIIFTIFHGISALHKVTAVELDAGFFGVYIHFYAAFIANYFYNSSGVGMFIENKIMVVTFTIFQLFVCIGYARTNSSGLRVIKWSAFHGL